MRNLFLFLLSVGSVCCSYAALSSLSASPDAGYNFAMQASLNFSDGVAYHTVATSGTGKYVALLGKREKYGDVTLYSSDGGLSWQDSASPSTNFEPTLLAMSGSGQYIYKLARNAVFFRSADYGVTYYALSLPWSFADDIVTDETGQFVLVPSGTFSTALWKSDNYGASFTDIQGTGGLPNVSAPSFKVVAASSDFVHLYALSPVYDGYYNLIQIYYSHDSGVTWTKCNTDMSGGWQGELAISTSFTGQYVLVGGPAKYGVGCCAWVSNDYGVNFVPQYDQYNEVKKHAHVSATGQYMVYGGINIYASADFGTTWTVTFDLDGIYENIAASNTSSVVYALGSDILYIGYPATAAPTAVPTTATPTTKPSAMPSAMPSAVPTAKPTAVPSAKPSAKPSTKPSFAPTAQPTLALQTEALLPGDVLCVILSYCFMIIRRENCFMSMFHNYTYQQH
jgi:hypothetical protein